MTIKPFPVQSNEHERDSELAGVLIDPKYFVEICRFVEISLQRTLSEILWNRVFHVSSKDRWNIRLTFQWPVWQIAALHCSPYESSDQKTSNMLNDEVLRLDRSAVATITPGMMTLSEHVSNKAFSDMSSGMMF